MEFTGIDNKRYITVDKIFSVHYFECAHNYSFDGETHDFWEFICVDKGEVNIAVGNEEITLHTNDVFFNEPNESYAVHADGKSGPNLIVVSFSCHDSIMQFFRHKKVQIDQMERELLGKIISEALRCFDGSLENPKLNTISLKESKFFGARQFLFLYLEQFLMLLLRRYLSPHFISDKASDSDMKSTKQVADAMLFSNIVKYLQQNLHTNITTEAICDIYFVGRSRLQKLFKQRCDLGVIEYFTYLKIEKAKELIRTQSMNFTQISESLGYSSIHYFSRQFKKITGITPSEYATSIKAEYKEAVNK